jgi:hypothetical protein
LLRKAGAEPLASPAGRDDGSYMHGKCQSIRRCAMI